MLLEDDIYQLFRHKTDHESFLRKYVKVANTLMFHDERFIRDITTYLKSEITQHASSSKVIVTKQDLINKNKWYIKRYNTFENQTSGSTGSPFRYLIWSDVYNEIECENHYKDILNEFGITGRVKILYLHFDNFAPNSIDLTKIGNTQNILISHGLMGQAEVHSAIANKTFCTNYYKYYEDLIEYSIDNSIDVIHTQNSAIESLAWNVKRLKIKEKLCKLISNTGTKLNTKSVIELQRSGNIEAWCDHMRCWDGGVTFFTCKYNTYHLLDSLAWAYSNDYRLISYDYFSLPSPFVNYWNGDYADISENYERCKCGRAFRRFEIGRTRSKTSQIAESSALQFALTNNDLLEGIKRVDVIRNFVRIFTKHSLPQEQRKSIKNVLPPAEIQFTVEEDLDE